MREIKFRAWDVSIKKMWDHAFISVNLEKVWNSDDTVLKKYIRCVMNNSKLETYIKCVMNNYNYNSTYVGSALDDLKVLQYTGLKDKKGQEIYEGDILRWYAGREKKYSDIVVRWDEDIAFFDLGEWCENEFPYTGNYALIIGNIYKNPDLNPDLLKNT